MRILNFSVNIFKTQLQCTPKDNLDDSATESDRNALEDGSAASPGRKWLVRRRFLDGSKVVFYGEFKNSAFILRTFQ